MSSLLSTAAVVACASSLFAGQAVGLSGAQGAPYASAALSNPAQPETALDLESVSGFTAISKLLDGGLHDIPKVAVPAELSSTLEAKPSAKPSQTTPAAEPSKPADDAKPGEAKPGDGQKPGATPDGAKPGGGQPEQGKPGDGKPGDGDVAAPVEQPKPVRDRVNRNCASAGQAGPQGRPGLSNSGALKPSGNVVVTQNGAVVENLDVRGHIDVRADNVTIRNVRITTNSRLGISVKRGHAGTKIRHVEIIMGGPGKTIDAGIGGVGDHGGAKGKSVGSNMTVENSYIHGNGDGIKIANYSTYRGNKIFAAKHKGSPLHVDGMQASGRHTFSVTYNDIAVHAGSANAPLFIQSWTAKANRDVHGVYVACNVFEGGVYGFHTEDGKGTDRSYFKGITAENNKFTTRHKYGKYHLDGPVHGNIGS